VVDVDGVAPVALAKAFTEDLHVPAHTKHAINSAHIPCLALAICCAVQAVPPTQAGCGLTTLWETCSLPNAS
jgi:hypothetical protein